MTGSDHLCEEAQPTRPMLLSLRAALRRGNPEILIQKNLFFRAELLISNNSLEQTGHPDYVHQAPDPTKAQFARMKPPQSHLEHWRV